MKANAGQSASLWMTDRRRGRVALLLFLVDQIVDAEGEVGAVEVAGEGRELAYTGNGAPGGAVEGVVVGGAFKDEAAVDAVVHVQGAVGHDGNA